MEEKKRKAMTLSWEGNIRERKEKRKADDSTYLQWSSKTLSLAMGLGYSIILPLVGSVLLGRFFDTRFSTNRFYTLLFFGIGMVLSFVNFFYIIKKNISSDDTKDSV